MFEAGLTYRPGLDRAPAQPLRRGHSQARGRTGGPGTSRARCGAGFASLVREVRANLLAGVTPSEAAIVDAAGGARGRVCAEFPTLSWLAATPEASLKGIRKVVAQTVEDLRQSGEEVPEPLSDRRYTGRFMVRVPPEVHRGLATRATEEGVSLNRLVSAKLAAEGGYGADPDMKAHYDFSKGKRGAVLRQPAPSSATVASSGRTRPGSTKRR